MQIIKLAVSTSFLIFVLLFSGCADVTNGIKSFSKELNKAFGQPTTAKEFLAIQEDKEMTKTFLNYFDITKNLMWSINSYGFTIDKQLVPFGKPVLTLYQVQGYLNKIDFENDEFAIKYKDVIAQRGNNYIVYKANISKRFFEALYGGELQARHNEDFCFYDYISTIVEVDKNNRMKSILIRKIEVATDVLISDLSHSMTRTKMITYVLNANATKLIENKINNSDLTENILSKSFDDKKVSTSDTTSNASRIKELYELYKEGAISKEEYDKEKAQILDKDNLKEGSHQEASSIQTQQPTNSFEAAFVAKFNQENGTNFTTMQEAINYKVSQKK